MPTIQVKDAGSSTIYLNVASGAGTSGDPYVLQGSIPAGTNEIGKLAAGTAAIGTVGVTSVTAGSTIGLEAGSAAVGTVGVTSISPGDNNIGNVDIASAIPAGDNNIGNVDIASALPAGTNEIGKLAAGTAAIGSLTAGTAAIGATKDNGPETAGTFTFTTSADMTTAGDIGPAPTSTEKSVLLQAVISTDTALQFTIQAETTAGAERQSWYLPANGSVIFVPRHPVKLGTADKKWQGIASVAGNVAISTVTTSEA